VNCRGFGGFIILATLLASCGETATTQDDPIRIGVVLSLSGELASVGDHLSSSAQLAAREINAAGGLLGGRPVELVVRDDRTSPDQAAVVTQQLLDDGVVAIVGSLASSATERTQALTAEAQVPQVSCCSTSSRLTEVQGSGDERFLFRTAPSDTVQARVLAMVAEEASCTRLAIMHVDDTYGQPFAAGIAQAIGETTVSLSEVVPFTSGRSSYSAEVNTVASANPDCVALVAFPDDGGAILRGWNELGSPPPVTWIGTDGVKDPGFPRAAGSDAYVDGVIGTAPIVEPDTPSANEFAAAYEITYGERPGIFGGNQYDAVILLALAIQAAGSTDGAAIRDALFRVANEDESTDTNIISGEMAEALALLAEGRDIDFDGASGPVNFDENGDVTTDYEVWAYDTESGFVRVDVISEADLSR
tara:strand:- start:1031 stop:2287 length:1257 start_codon:yes stop_codon:yes gene_type:complete